MEKQKLEKYHKLLHKVHSNLMMQVVDNMKSGILKDITFNEIRTIEIIGDLKESPMRQIADKAKVKQSTMTATVDKLVKKALAARYYSDEDRRAVKIRLTKKGEKAYDEHQKAHYNRTKSWLSILNEKERASLKKILKKAVKKVSE